MSAPIRIVDITDAASFLLVPPCADPGFDHRSCDYWEDEVRGSKAARSDWWQPSAPRAPEPIPKPRSDNPFAPPAKAADDFNPFARGPGGDDASTGGGLFGLPGDNPFEPTPPTPSSEVATGAPRKLRLLDRGAGVFGSYAKVLLVAGEPAAYTQFGPLSAYPRARHIRELYPHLPQSPLPAVITCIATTAAARGQGLGARLIEAVIDDLGERGFSAIEAYPDMTLDVDQASAASPAFWQTCGFELAADDDRYPVMRHELA